MKGFLVAAIGFCLFAPATVAQDLATTPSIQDIPAHDPQIGVLEEEDEEEVGYGYDLDGDVVEDDGMFSDEPQLDEGFEQDQTDVVEEDADVDQDMELMDEERHEVMASPGAAGVYFGEDEDVGEDESTQSQSEEFEAE